MRKIVIGLFFVFVLTAFQQAVSQTQISIALQSGSSDSICGNSVSVSFVATVTNCTNPSYQWYINNIIVNGQTGKQWSNNTFTNGDVVTCKQTSNTAPCSEATSNGITINIKPNQALSWINSSGNVNQTMCQYTSINPIKFQVIGATSATVNGLPTGVTGSYNNGELIISGAPTQNGTFNYQVSTTGSNLCGSTAQTGGTLTVNQAPNADLGPNPENNIFKLCSPAGSGELKFNNLSTTKSSNTAYKIVWGDNTATYDDLTFSSIVPHTYNAGTYSLVFSVLGNNGCTSSNTYTIFIGSNPAVGIGNPGNTSICSNDSLVFPITGTSTNTTGTRYIVSFNDGSKADTFYHPNVPSSISHVFKINSCGITSGGSSNSFQASISAANPCLASYGSVVPIYVSGRPKAAFSTAKDTICLNTTATFSNNSLTTSYISNGNCVAGKFVWSITPSTGWSVTSGTLGSESGSTDPLFWLSASNTINIKFTTIGTYAIKVKTGNSNCGSDSIIKTICVNPLPVAGFTVDQATGCLPLTVQATNTSNLPNCGSNIYTWAVTYTATGSCLPATSSFTYLGGTNASSTNPQFRFDNPGTYTISLITKNSAGDCISSAFTKQIIIKAKPSVTLNAATSVCQNGSITPSITVGNCNSSTAATYVWTFVGGIPATATSVSPGSITYATPGTYTIQVDVTNECGTTTKTQQLTVGLAPDIIVPTNQTFCNGVATGILAFSSGVNGTTYSWTNNNTTIGLPASGNGNVPNFIAKNTTGVPVTATITATPLNGCTGQSQSFTITVNPGATIANAGIDQKLCNATNTTLTANAAVVGTGTWTKIAGNSGIVDNAALPTSTVSGLTAPDSVVLVWTIQNAANACKGTSDTVVILNRPIITIANAGNDTTVCDFTATTNNFINLSGNKDATRSFETGTWSIVSQPVGGNGIIANANNPLSKFSFLKAGSYILKWTIINDGGCTATSKTMALKVNDKPVKGSITPAVSNICIGANAALTLSGYTGVILKWQYNPKPIADNIWIDTLVTTTSLNFNNTQDTFAVRAIIISADALCVSSDTTVSVLVNVASLPIGGTTGPDATVCGANNNGIVTLSGQVGNILRWEKSIDNGTTWTTIINPTTSQLYSTILQTTKFRAIIQNGACATVTSSITTISVAGATGSSNAGADQFLCNQTSTQLNAAVAPAGSIGTWLQVAGPAATITDATLYNTTITTLTANTYKFVWAISNGVCAATNDTVVVINYPALTNTVTGINTTICVGQSVTIVGQNAAGGSGLYTYQWQQSTDSITWVNIAGATLVNINFSPTITVFVRRLVTSNACNLPSNAATIVVQPSIGSNTITKDTTICIGNTLATLTGSLPTGGNTIYTYQWEKSTDGGITWLPITSATAKDYLPVGVTITTKFRRVVNSNVCTGLQASSSNVVTITINPDANAQYTYTKDIDCAIFNVTNAIKNVTSAGNGSYVWYANNVQIGSSATVPNYSITNPLDSVVIKLKVISLYGCKNDSLEHKFYTVPKPTPAFTVSDTLGCGPLAVSITNKTANANLFNFKWDFGNGITSNLVNPGSIILQPNPTHFDTIYTITLSAFTPCDTVVTVQKVRVKAKPQALFTPNKSVGCSPFPVTFSNTSRGNGMNFIWDFGDGSATLATNSTNAVQHTYSTGKQDTFKVKLIAINACGNDTLIYNIVVSPNKIKLDFAVNGSDAVSCLPSTVRFINNTSGATSFNWDFGDGNFLTTTKNIDTVTHIYTTAGTFITKLSATNGCSDTSDVEQIKTYAKPLTKFTAAPLTACLGDSIYFTNKTDTATGYTWRYGDGNGSVLTNPTYAYKTVGTYKASLVAIRQYNGIACADSAATTITVVGKLVGSFKVSDSVSTCVPFKVVFTNLSVPSILTTWDYGDAVNDTGNLVQHTYTTSGTFIAKMTAVNAGGCTYESTKTIIVKGPAGTWVYDKGLICAKKSVQFQVNAVNTDSLRFNFGDGTFLTTTNAIVNHTYTQSGNYLPSVQLLAGAGCYVTLQGVDTIKIDNVKAGFVIAQQKVCGSTTVGFADTSRSFYGIQTWQWNYGDGTPVGTTQNVQHTYTVANTYPVQLIVVGKSGCTDTATLQLPITINTKPNATIQAAAFGCTNQKITYTANITSVDSVLLKVWKLSNGTNIIGATATYIYPTAGTYTTAFVVGTINGCYDTAYNTITINPSPTVVASADVTICKGQSTQLLASGSGNFVWTPIASISCTNCTNPSAFPLVTTNYVVSSTNGFGCTYTDSVVVTVIQPFAISVTPSDSICIGQSTKLGASGGFSYTWSPSVGLSNPNIQNPVASPVVTTNYQVTAKDQYNCFTATANVIVGVGDYPVVKLGQDQVLAAGSSYTFIPTFTNGPIANWLWTPSANLDCTTCPSVTATAKNDICYTATATSIYGCAASDTVCIKVFCESSQVFIPNAFMPGTGTGVNDVLMVRGQGIKLVKSFRIYNRWGQVVFERANFVPNVKQYGWNGLIQGKPANTDVYIYTCEVVCENDTPFVYKGNVAILR